jgi:hemerythrin
MGNMLSWNSQYSVGVEKIDSQHKELFDRINILLNAMKLGNGKEEVINTLDFLEQYVNKHFMDEEQIQRDTKYSGYDIQHKQHDEFRYKLKELRIKFENDGINTSLVISTQKEMTDWWRNHITKLDSELGKHIINVNNR